MQGILEIPLIVFQGNTAFIYKQPHTYPLMQQLIGTKAHVTTMLQLLQIKDWMQVEIITGAYYTTLVNWILGHITCITVNKQCDLS